MSQILINILKNEKYLWWQKFFSEPSFSSQYCFPILFSLMIFFSSLLFLRVSQLHQNLRKNACEVLKNILLSQVILI